MATCDIEPGECGRNLLLYEAKMSRVVALASDQSSSGNPLRTLPDTFLGCYEITNQDKLRWGVRVYKARRSGVDQSHAELRDAKQAIWELRKKNPGVCRGYGFVVPVDEETIVVSAGWLLPSGVSEGDYLISFESEFTTDLPTRDIGL